LAWPAKGTFWWPWRNLWKVNPDRSAAQWAPQSVAGNALVEVLRRIGQAAGVLNMNRCP
jgi:hypothetical protein